MCSEEVLNSQDVAIYFVPELQSKGDQDHSDQQQPPKVCGKYSRADCGNVFQ